MLFRPFPVVLVTLLALGAVASTSVAAVGGATPQIVLLDPGTNAQTKATREQRRGNDVTDVYTHAVDGFAAMLDPADIARLKADPSVMSIEPDARVSIDAAAANDMFANATVVSASSGSKTGSTTDATRENREPRPIRAWGNKGKSIWYSWTAPITGSLSLDTHGSSYDTLLAISTGSAISALTNVGANDDAASGGLQSAVTVNVTAGITYRIVIDGYGGLSGTTNLNWLVTPNRAVNDAFADATLITGSQGSAVGSTVDTTRETAEPAHTANGGSGGAHSIWYRWVAPGDGSVSFSTSGSAFATLLGAYTGTSVSALSLVPGATTTTPSGVIWKSMSLPVTNGTPYYVGIDGQSGASGTTALGWNFTSASPPTVSGAPGWGLNPIQVNGTSITATLTPPATDGGSPVSRYTVSCTPSGGGVQRIGESPIISVDVTGLAAGTTYACTAQATNAAGSSGLTPAPIGFTIGNVPGAPTGVVATARDGAASVTWTPPAYNGSNATDYTVSSSGSSPRTCTTTQVTCLITGLTNNVPYTFTVRAINAIGTGTASALSPPVTPGVPLVSRDPAPAPTPTPVPADPDQITEAMAITGPGRPQNRVALTWNIDRLDQRGATLDGRYAVPLDGTGVTAYVIDTGVMADHSEFDGRMLAGMDGVGDGNGTGDCNGHGTHVAGTIAGQNYGVAPMARIVPIRVLGCSGDGSVSGVIAGIDWMVATHAADTPAVANMSMGAPSSAALNAAVDRAVADGITVAVAAGNNATDACSTSPASDPRAITVAATDDNDARAPFSNYGSCVTLFAPGANIESASNTGVKDTQILSGTSMATPHATGVAALLLSGTPSATPKQVKQGMVDATTPGVVIDAGPASPNLLLFANAWAVSRTSVKRNSGQLSDALAVPKVPRIKSVTRTKRGLRIVVVAGKGVTLKVFVNGRLPKSTKSTTILLTRHVKKGARLTVKAANAAGTSKASKPWTVRT